MRKISVILSAILVFCLTLACAPMVSADTAPVITVSQKSAVPGDSVAINVDISGNTGIMAMAFGIKYDADAFTFAGYAEGYISGPSITNDAELGLIHFVSCESGDVSSNGTIVTINFTVNDTASPQKHKIRIVNNNYDYYGPNLHGCFSKRGEIAVTPAVRAGSIEVGATCSNSPHIFGDWTVDVEPTCTREGLRSRNCPRCGHIENQFIDPNGHDFEEEWTVDREATKEIAGEMSRHCKNCDSVTDVMLFELEEAEQEDIDNTEDSKVSQDKAENLEDFKNLPPVRDDGAIDEDDREELFVTDNEEDSDDETESLEESNSQETESDEEAIETDKIDDNSNSFKNTILKYCPLALAFVLILIIVFIVARRRKNTAR